MKVKMNPWGKGLILVEKLDMSMVSSGVTENPHLDCVLGYLFSRTAK